MARAKTNTEATGLEATDAKASRAKRPKSTLNYETDIDFSTGKSAEELTSDKAQGRGLWPRKLQALKEGVEAGRGERGVFYRVGEFNNGSGAQSVIRGFTRNPEKLPGVFDLEARTLIVNGERVSELWAAVPAD